MAPIRVGFIGLSSSGWAPAAHLPYLQTSDKYQLVAICNSSIESSKAAIKLYKLPESTKAYGNPEDIAKDSDVDLVVCSVRADRHFETVKPSLQAGKDVYVEWPLGSDLAQVKEMLRLKNEGGVKNAVVGLQGRQAPIVNKIKDLLDSGSIGTVLNTTWSGYGGNSGGGASVQDSFKYLSDIELGANLLTIHFGHSIDWIQHILGYGFSPAPKTLLANRRKFQRVLDKDGKVLSEKREKTSHDTLFLHGVLKSGIPLSVTLRGGERFKGSPGLDFRIYGETGELRITASGPFLQVGYPDMKIELFDFEKDTVKDIVVEQDSFDRGGVFGLAANNVGRVYEELAEGRNNCSFEDAVERHELLEDIYKENGVVF